MLRKTLVLSFVLFFLLPVSFLRAEKAQASVRGFSIHPSQDWMELPLPLQGVLVSYGKKGTLATFHIIERELEKSKVVDQLSWRDLFSPQFEAIKIHKEGEALLAGEKARFCIYSLKPGEFKTTMEGKLPGKYINYVLIHNDKLFSITFKDTEDGFALNYPSFLAAIRTFQFDAPASQAFRKRS